MRNRTRWLAFAVVAALILGGAAVAEPQGKGGFGDKAGCADKGQVGLGKGGFISGFGDKGGCADKGQVGLGNDEPARGFGGKAGPGKQGPPGGFGGKGGAFPGGKGGKGGGPPGARGDVAQRGPSGDDIVERVLSFDKDKDGKVGKDELPERMQDLITKGDANKDGALDKDEIKKLATELAKDGSLRGLFGPGGGFGPGGFGSGGAFGPRAFGPGGGIEAALDDLKLSDKKKDQAEAAAKAHQENVRKLMDLARADLLLKMREVLSEEEFKDFKAALDRQPPFGDRPFGRGGPPFGAPPPGAPRAGDLERRLEQLQKDLDSLRRELRR